MEKVDFFKELEIDFVDLLKKLQAINPNISVSSNLFATTFSVHINNEALCHSFGVIEINGFMLGLITAHTIQQKNN